MGAISGLGPNKATLDLLRFRAWNASGGTLTKGTPVYVSGWDAASSSPKVAKADADAAGKRAQFFIQDNDCTNGSGCIVGFTYYLTGANTNGAAVGDPVYLDTTAGGWVLADPSAITVDLQVIGRVHVVSATVGEIFFNTLIETQVLKVGSNGIQAGAGATGAAAGGDLAGTYLNPTVSKSSTAFALTGDISPAALAAGTDNWAPTGLSTASVIRVDLTGSQELTGITGGADGRLLVLHNIDGGADTLTLKNDTTSTAANRFLLTGDVVVAPQESVLLQYDSTVSRWRLIKTSGAPSGAAGGKLSGTYPNPGMAVGFITADATGRAYFGAGVLDKATALSAFAADSLDNTFLLDAVENGAFVADDATRALFAANFLGNSVTGRGLMQTGWFDVATVLDKFATDSVANAALIQLIADGSFQADSATRALFADGIWTSAKMSENLIKYADVSASSAQLKDLFANPLQMVAAPGAGKVLEFISATMILDYGTTHYDTQGTLVFQEETSATALSGSIADTWLFAVADKMKVVQAIDAFTTANKGIFLSCATANPATGDSVARIKVAYRVHTTGL